MVNHPNRSRRQVIEAEVEAMLADEDKAAQETYLTQIAAMDDQIMKMVRDLATMSTRRDACYDALRKFRTELEAGGYQ